MGPGICVCRVGSSMYFANSSYIEDKITQLVEIHQKHDDVHYVVVSMGSITSVDTSALHHIKQLVKDMGHRNIRVCFANVGNRVWQTFDADGLVDLVGEEWFHETCHDAVNHCLAWDSTHIDQESHFVKDHELLGLPLTLDVDAFGVHI